MGVYFLANTGVPFGEFILTFGKRWDGNSYTFITDNWYVTTGPEKYFIVFPPLYPILVKLLSFLGFGSVLSGIILSNILFVAGMVLLYKLILLDYKPKVALLTIILISVFPTTFFFSVAYPESLFVFLFALTFYLARKRNYIWAYLAGGLTVLTRPFGILLLPALALQRKKLFILGLAFGIPIAIYLLINYLTFGNPFTFLDFLKENWQKSFSFPWEGIIASWKRGLYTSQEEFNYKYLVGYGEATTSTLAWVFVFVGIKKWGIKHPYWICLFLSTILFTSTGFILSAPRYLLSIPPFFILLADLLHKNKILTAIWIVTSVALLFYISYEFAWGHWTF